MSKEIKSLQELFELCGGASKIAFEIGIHQFSVERWRKTGIPAKHWPVLFRLSDATPAEVYSLNKKILANKGK